MSSLSFLPLTLLDPPMYVTVGEHKEDLIYKLDFNDSSSSYVLLLTFNTCVRMPWQEEQDVDDKFYTNILTEEGKRSEMWEQI